jgi:mannose-6-phosphate isomerase-like protein (cupin superfamily)
MVSLHRPYADIRRALVEPDLMAGAVVNPPRDEDGQPLRGPEGTFHVLIDPSRGSERLLQQVIDLPPGGSGGVGHPGIGEDVLYVVQGSGLLASAIREEQHLLSPGTAALVSCKLPASAHNTGTDELVLISVWSPPPFEGFFTMEAHDHPLTSLHENDRERLPAGEDRSFKVLIETKHVTQFVGLIERSKAPPHTHLYEEAIYVLEGEGTLHSDGAATPIRPGTSIFLPPDTPHCLENRGPGVLKIVGVFSPPGSPAGKVEASAYT